MDYYVLSQKEEPGCPSRLDAALYDKFYANTEHVKHGKFPWYTRNCEMKRGCVFPENGVLICEDDYYDFDVRGVSHFFYVVSDEFLAVCKDLNVDIVDSAKVKVVSVAGAEISSKKYNVVLFNELDPKSDSDPSSTFIEEDGLPFRIKSLVLPVSWGFDLFKYGKLISGSGSLICSGRFKDLGEEFRGVNYKPLDGLIWSSVKRI